MKKLLEEHSKRQNMFYGIYASFIGYLEVLLPLLRENPDMAAVVRDRYERIQFIVSDCNPREVLKKVKKKIRFQLTEFVTLSPTKTIERLYKCSTKCQRVDLE